MDQLGHTPLPHARGRVLARRIRAEAKQHQPAFLRRRLPHCSRSSYEQSSAEFEAGGAWVPAGQGEHVLDPEELE